MTFSKHRRPATAGSLLHAAIARGWSAAGDGRRLASGRSRSSSGTSGSPRRSRRTPTSWAIRSPTISRRSRESRSGRSASMIPTRGSAPACSTTAGADLVGPRAARRDHARDRSVDRREDQGRNALADRAPLGALVDAVRRGHERANATRLRPPSSKAAGNDKLEVEFVPPPQRYTRSPRADPRSRLMSRGASSPTASPRRRSICRIAVFRPTATTASRVS